MDTRFPFGAFIFAMDRMYRIARIGRVGIAKIEIPVKAIESRDLQIEISFPAELLQGTSRQSDRGTRNKKQEGKTESVPEKRTTISNLSYHGRGGESSKRVKNERDVTGRIRNSAGNTRRACSHAGMKCGTCKPARTYNGIQERRRRRLKSARAPIEGLRALILCLLSPSPLRWRIIRARVRFIALMHAVVSPRDTNEIYNAP